jgi:N6-adenosine-specific RNA methylase IME4
MELTAPFRVVTADPPWAFSDKLPATRGAESHYDCMSIDDIYKLDLPRIADDALLFLWRVAALQQEALNVMHMWGFDLKSEIVWVKSKKGVVIEDPEAALREDDMAFGMGRYTRHCHEVCLIGARGRAATKVVKNHSTRSVFVAERQEHSQKPEEFFAIVEKLTRGEGPYLELFARQQRPGWTTLGHALGTHLTSEGVSRTDIVNGEKVQ